MLARINALLASRPGRALRYVFSLGLIAWLASSIDWHGLTSLRDTVSPLLFAAALATAAAAYPLCALRWQILLHAQNVQLPAPRIHAIVWIGQFYNAFLPGGIGGDAARLGHAFTLAPRQKTAIATATLADRISGFGVLLALALPAAFLHASEKPLRPDLGPWLGIAGTIGVFAVLGLAALRWLPPGLSSRWTIPLREAGKNSRSLIAATVLSAAVWLLDFLSGWLLARSLGLDIPFWTLSLALIAAYLSALLPLSIGGHGIREGALVLALTALTAADAGAGTFSAFALLFLAITVFCSLFGGIVLLLEPAARKKSGDRLSPCALNQPLSNESKPHHQRPYPISHYHAMTTPERPQSEGVFERRSTRQTGFVFDEFALDSAWLRESASVQFPPLVQLRRVTIRGEFRLHPEAQGIETSLPTLTVFLADKKIATVTGRKPGPWEITLDVPLEDAGQGFSIRLALSGVAFTNLLAWAGRVFSGWPLAARLQRFRLQNKNRQLRIARVEADGELVYDFGNRHSPYSPAFARKHAHIGLNIVGFLSADLGIGESARCMVRAADAAQIPAAAVALKLPCKARMGDNSYSPFLQDKNPYGVNVFHLDAPAIADVDTHHGAAFRAGKYNIGYWAWELPEFPDAWIPYFDFLHEIWCPSDFVRAAIADKSPLPVVTMPHAIKFRRPVESTAQLRAKFGLPSDKFLFLFLYDLHSYSERKNPRAVLAAFRESGLAAKGAALVIKVHGTAGNETDLVALQTAAAEFPGTVLLTDAFSRADIYALEAACDCFVSLHRAEGFGLAIAECMYLGKPVIATDWSATAEYVNASNGCPVRAKLVTLERNHGPYSKGQTWADPDIAHAADWMRRLHADRALCERLGTAARATIEEKFSPEAIGARYRRRLEAIASW